MGFEAVNTGLGEEWDFDEGPLDGIYVGGDTISVPDNNGAAGVMRDATYYQFMVDNETRFVWGSYSIDQAFSATDPNDRSKAAIAYGDRVMIEYKGKREISGGKTVRQYSVNKWVEEPAGKK